MKPFLVVTTLAALTQIATAEPDKAAGKQRFAEGKTKYAAGDYRGAAEKFAAAYQADPDPAYIFNVGQAYRRIAEAKPKVAERDCQQAMVAYKRFLEQLPAASNRAEVEGYIRDMTACAGPLANEVTPPPPPIDKPPPPIDQPPPPPIDKPPSTTPATDTGTSGKRYAGIGAGVAGLVACGVGAYFLKVSADKADEHDTLVRQINGGTSDATPDDVRRIDDEGAAANRNATIGLVLGGALVATGVVLYVVGGKRSKEPALAVAPSKDGAMVLGAFRF